MIRRRPWLVLLPAAAVAALALAGQVRAESASTLTSLARQIGEVRTSGPVFVGVTPLAGAPLAEPERTALEAKLVRVLGTAVAAARARGEAPMTESTARARARALGLNLMLIEPTLSGGQLIVDVDVIEWERSFWARARKPSGTVVSHASVGAAADAEIRRYLPRPKGLLSKESRFRAPAHDAIGLACGEVSEQVGMELLVIGRHQLFLGRLVTAPTGGRGSLSIRKSALWTTQSPLSPHPLRAPLAGAWLQPGRVLVGSSDRADLVLMDEQLGTPTFAAPALPIAGDRCHAFTATGLAREAKPCGPLTGEHHQAKTAALEVPSHDSVAHLVEPDERGVAVNYELVSSKAELRVTIDSPIEQRRIVTLPPGGAQVALADLDGDGVVEAITTASTDGATDTVRVHALRKEGPVLVASRDVGSVRALAVCPFDGENPQRLAVLLTDEIRIFE